MTSKLLKTIDIIEKLSCVSRFSQTHLLKQESVLEHTGFVALLAYTIGNNLIDEGHELNIGDLLSKAVVHDIDEIITGDIPRPTKYANSQIKKEIEKIEKKNIGIISEEICDIIYSDWLYAKNATPEGSIIAICDSIAVVYKIYSELYLMGNNSVFHNLPNEQNLISAIIKLDSYWCNESKYLQSLISDVKILFAVIVKKHEELK